MKVNEEVKAAITKSVPDAALQATLIAALEATKTVARTPEEEDQYKANLLTASKDDLIKEEKQIIMRRVEDDVKELTGLRQKPSEPYHEFMKRGFKELKGKLEDIEAQKEEWEKSGGSQDGVWKQKYTTLETQSKTALSEKDREMETLKKSVAATERRIELDKVLNPLASKFAPDLPSYFNDFKENVIRETVALSAIIDGKLVLVDEQGNPRKDNNLNNILVEDHLKLKFKDVIREDRQQGGSGNKGGGTPPPGGNGGGKAPVSINNVPEEVNSEAKLTEFLGKQGLLQGTKDFDDNYSRIIKEKNITKLL